MPVPPRPSVVVASSREQAGKSVLAGLLRTLDPGLSVIERASTGQVPTVEPGQAVVLVMSDDLSVYDFSGTYQFLAELAETRTVVVVSGHGRPLRRDLLPVVRNEYVSVFGVPVLELLHDPALTSAVADYSLDTHRFLVEVSERLRLPAPSAYPLSWAEFMGTTSCPVGEYRVCCPDVAVRARVLIDAGTSDGVRLLKVPSGRAVALRARTLDDITFADLVRLTGSGSSAFALLPLRGGPDVEAVRTLFRPPSR